VTELTNSNPRSRTAVALIAGNSALPVVTAAIFAAAALLFWVQPMFGKMVLPLLGGSPAVWTTALLFFQSALLLGYLYAHALGSLFPVRTQIIIHIAVVTAALVLLPIAVPTHMTPPADGAPSAWLVWLFTLAVGIPYTVVAATSPLLQRWFASSEHKDASNPYHLYVASNAGSLIGLLGYPLLVEPLVGLSAQTGLWSEGYALLTILIALSGFAIWRLAPRAAPVAHATAIGRVGNFDRLRWIALAFVPSSLLLGVTSHITTDIAAIPLIWAAPLSLYLITFMLAFAKKPWVSRASVCNAEGIALIVLTVFVGFAGLGFAGLLLNLAGFFVIAWARHGALADAKPSASHLTEFYLWLSFGGALGGVFNAVIAPVIFTRVLEYPLALVAAAATRALFPGDSRRPAWPDLALPAAAGIAAIAIWQSGVAFIDLPNYATLALAAPFAIAVYYVRARPLRFALGLAAMFVLLQVARHNPNVLIETRSFFGAYRVTTVLDGRYNVFAHGTTRHGVQATDPAQRREPLGYYALRGPLGQAIESMKTSHPRLRYGVVGLGAGASLCYGRPSDGWTLYEIDPVVVAIARDSGAFTYMKDCAPEARVVLGDARLALAREPDGIFDVLVLDAFSSDAIPMHLVTKEALALARAKLAPGGVILFNISNRHLRLEPIVANAAHAVGLSGLSQFYADPPNSNHEIRSASHWIALSADKAALAPLARAGRWRTLRPDPSASLWTDDYSNILGAIAFRR
jgi:hypothetical protein